VSPGKFNPYDLSKREKLARAAHQRNHFQITVRPELTNPLSVFLGRCEMFLERARASNQVELMLELQKVLSSGKYLSSIINTSEELRRGIVEFELGTAASESDTRQFVRQSLPPPKPLTTESGTLLVVDDDKRMREMLEFVLQEQGHTVETVASGEEGLSMLHTREFDLVLCDLMMPGINGYQFLDLVKTNMAWRQMPIVVMSAIDDITSAARCIQMGAEDYLPKPIDAVLLIARINACLEKKRLGDLEQGYVHHLQAEQEKSERLLLNILPAPIAERLKSGENVIADSFVEVTVLFADIAGFTKLATEVSPVELVERLNEIFSAFDRLAEKHRLEKIKTIGDAYMCVGGLPTPLPNHAEAIAEMALDMQQEIFKINAERGTQLSIRVGFHTGPVIAGIIGKKKFNYDLWGDTVNTASRMESAGHPGHIQTSESTYQLLRNKYVFAKRPPIEVKGKGAMTTYLLMGRLG
jgi:class 3 adenylate cyclase